MSIQLISTIFIVALVSQAAGAAADPSGPGDAAAAGAFGKLPLYFVENKGQVDSDEAFYYVKGADKTLYFGKQGIVFALEDGIGRWAARLDFVDSNPNVVPRGEDIQKAVFSYFRGRPAAWDSGCASYRKVTYRDLWPGIDLTYSGTVNELKYEFVVREGADPGQIRLRYHGTSSVDVSAAGALEVTTPAGEFEDAAPYAYQGSGDRREQVSVSFALEPHEDGSCTYSFALGDYDPRRRLIIDPVVLLYCGYIGGSKEDEGEPSIALDADGNAYVTGSTYSNETTFPVAVGPDLTFNNNTGRPDAFVAKVSATGTELLYCGYIGGIGNDAAYGVAVDEQGCAYVSGWTYSDASTFPVKVGPSLILAGENDVFVAKVNPAGTDLVYCGYIGGESFDLAGGIALDSLGCAYVTGNTQSDETTFPVHEGPDQTFNGQGDAFVAKVGATGEALEYCGYIGGAGSDIGRGIAVDNLGNCYVSGVTNSTESTFPVTIGPDLSFNGGIYDKDAFVAKIGASGTALDYCGYIGGSDQDHGWKVAVDTAGCAHVTGMTRSEESSFPVKGGPDLSHNGDYDVFVSKIAADGTGLEFCGYIGGSGEDSGLGIALDAAGNVFVSGVAESDETTFPVVAGPDLTHNGGYGGHSYDAFVAKIRGDDTQLDYCGYIGGQGWDYAWGVAVDGCGDAYVAGRTDSQESSFPVAKGPDLEHNGLFDVFVAKIGVGPLVDIKCNGEDADVIVSSGDNVTITIEVDPEDHAGKPADVWVLGRDPDGNKWSYGAAGLRWYHGWCTEYQSGPLSVISDTVFDKPLSPGRYKVWLAIDMNANGNLNVPRIREKDAVSFDVVP